MDIKTIIENINTYTIDEFFKLWEAQKDVFMIKYDGLRDENKYTVLLLANENRFDTLHVDCEEILCGIEEILSRYQSILENIEDQDSED